MVDAGSHLFVVLCCALLTTCYCFLDKLLTGGLEGWEVNLPVLGEKVNVVIILVLVSGSVLHPFAPIHGADLVGKLLSPFQRLPLVLLSGQMQYQPCTEINEVITCCNTWGKCNGSCCWMSCSRWIGSSGYSEDVDCGH